MTIDDLEREWDEWLARPRQERRATGGVYAFFRFKELQVARYRAELEYWKLKEAQPPVPPWKEEKPERRCEHCGMKLHGVFVHACIPQRCKQCGYTRGICACGSIGSGVEQSEARQAHNLEDAGANPAPATYEPDVSQEGEGAQGTGGDRYRAPDPFAPGMPVAYTENTAIHARGEIGFIQKGLGVDDWGIRPDRRIVRWVVGDIGAHDPRFLQPIAIGTIIRKGDSQAMVRGIGRLGEYELDVQWKEGGYIFDEETLKEWRVELSEG